MKRLFNRTLTRTLYFVALFIFLWIRPETYGEIDKGYLFVISTIFLCIIILHFLSGDKSNWFRLDVFFILGFTIVHFQWPIMYSFSNIAPDNYWEIFVDDRLMNYSVWLSAIGGTFFLLGYNLFSSKRLKLNRPLATSYDYSRLLIFTTLSFIIFVIYAGNNFLSGGIYKGEGGSGDGGGISKYFALLFRVGLMLLTTLIIFQNRKNYKGNLLKWFAGFNKIYLGVVVSYILLFWLIGDRGGPLALILTILILIGSFVRKFRFVEVAIITILGGFLMTIIGLGRSEASGFEIFEAGSDKLENTSGYDSTVELANSIRTLNTAVSHVPGEHDYFYGSLWVAPLLGPIPFAQSLYLDFTNLEWFEIDTSGYITYLTLGKYPTWGLGTSLMADIYMNFGLGGVIFFMLVLGFFMKRLSIELIRPSSFNWLIIAATIAGISLYYSRSGYFSSFRDIVWGIFFFKLLVIKRKPKRKSV